MTTVSGNREREAGEIVKDEEEEGKDIDVEMAITNLANHLVWCHCLLHGLGYTS